MSLTRACQQMWKLGAESTKVGAEEGSTRRVVPERLRQNSSGHGFCERFVLKPLIKNEYYMGGNDAKEVAVSCMPMPVCLPCPCARSNAGAICRLLDAEHRSPSIAQVRCQEADSLHATQRARLWHGWLWLRCDFVLLDIAIAMHVCLPCPLCP